MTIDLVWLAKNSDASFPSVDRALAEPNGLLAAGGDLSSVRLLNAYRHGIFPWFSEGQPILWWSPNPRMVFRTDSMHLAKRFRQQLKKSAWEIRVDTCFKAVIERCAHSPRGGEHGTWIHHEMIDAYCQLHAQGHAHSVEVFSGNTLVGGIYGIAIGKMFFGESMFSLESGGSKAALAGLAYLLNRWGFPLIDAQVESEHLQSLGAVLVPREEFMQEIKTLCQQREAAENWRNLPISFLASQCLPAKT
jgi:leucyl/phenylalanyl-tRNA---protein transferase